MDNVQVARITIPQVITQFRAYYQKPGNGWWGSLHVVLDDGNVEDSSVRWCIGYEAREGDEDGERLARILLQMTRTQRLKLMGMIR